MLVVRLTDGRVHEFEETLNGLKLGWTEKGSFVHLVYRADDVIKKDAAAFPISAVASIVVRSDENSYPKISVTSPGIQKGTDIPDHLKTIWNSDWPVPGPDNSTIDFVIADSAKNGCSCDGDLRDTDDLCSSCPFAPPDDEDAEDDGPECCYDYHAHNAGNCVENCGICEHDDLDRLMVTHDRRPVTIINNATNISAVVSSSEDGQLTVTINDRI